MLERPKEWKTNVLDELRKKLRLNEFPEEKLQNAHKLVYDKALADIISMVKHADREEEPICTAEERVDQAMKRITTKRSFNKEQIKWLGYIREHLIKNLTIGMEDFEYAPVFERHGGKGKADKVFNNELESLMSEINYKIAA
ncbi:MAG: hypothetical protein KAI50_10595 [Desulfobacterales bacterium]|nr:hypothetical protein [Desulfobacterales bacterium]